MEEIVEKIEKWYKNSSTHLHERYTEIREEFDFYAADQWSEEDKSKLASLNRPVITFDRVTPVINSVSGFETSNRDEIRYIPRTDDDHGGNDLYTEAARWARDETDADDEQSDAFKDCVICGYGWTNTEMDYEDNPDGVPREDRVPPLEMFYDSSARKMNLTDARYVIRAKNFNHDEMESLWPGKADEIIQTEMMFQEGDFFAHNADEDFLYKNDQSFGEKKKKYLVLHAQWYEREPYYRFIDPETGKTLSVPDEKYQKIKEALDSSGVKAVRQTKKVYYQATISGKTVLEERKKLAIQGQFTYECITGYRNERKNHFFGLMKLMMDPQRWSNKFFSQFLDIVSANAKGGAFAEEGYFSNPRKAEEDWGDPSALIMMKEGGLNKIKERQQQPFPSSTDRLLQIAVTATRDVTGINLEFLGLANRDQAGVLETERKRSALVILSDLFNSLRRFKRRQGRILLQYIHQFMRDGQLIRIVGEQGAKYIPFKKDQSAIDYDVVVDTAPDSPNMKQEAWQSLRQLIPQAISANIPIPPDIIKLAPIPESVSAKWIQYIQDQSKPDELSEKAKQLELQKLELENQETQSKTALNMAKAQSETDPNEAERIAVEKLRIFAEQQKLQIESQLKQQETQVKNFDVEVKLRQSLARIEEARLKAESEIRKSFKTA